MTFLLRPHSMCFLFSALLILCLYSPSSAAPKDTMRYIYHPPESALDVRYTYQWVILKTALEKTKTKYGPYMMQTSELMTETRQTMEMKNATGKLTVMYLSTTSDLERELIPIRIPVDKNLGGYCLLLIRQEDQAKFSGIKTLDELRQFSYGFGLGWIDVDILKANNFNVITGSSYDGLFEMLSNKRFDVFLRATVEILDEVELRKKRLPNLHIEDSLLFYYPLPMYFWFTKNDEGKRLAARAEEGMWMMIRDGSYGRIFDKYQGFKINILRLKSRRLFKIDNPNLGSETPFSDKRLWFDPHTYKAVKGKK